MVRSIVLVASTVIGSSVCEGWARADDSPTMSATNEIPQTGAHRPFQPPILTPVPRLNAAAGGRPRVARACWLAVMSALVGAFLPSVAFVNGTYYRCQGTEYHVKTAL